jgi:hypothetical protein
LFINGIDASCVRATLIDHNLLRQAGMAYEFLNIPITQGISYLAAHGHQNNSFREMTAFERQHGLGLLFKSGCPS